MQPIADASHLGRHFAAYTEHAFINQLGVSDTPLIDYVSGLLIRFVHRDQIFSHQQPSGRRSMAIVDLAEEIARSEEAGATRRELFRHLGDFALFWTGVFPEAVKSRRAAALDIETYTEQGKRSYYVASTYVDTPEQKDEAPILRRLSSQFELCAVGLRAARDLWESDRKQWESEG